MFFFLNSTLNQCVYVQSIIRFRTVYRVNMQRILLFHRDNPNSEFN